MVTIRFIDNKENDRYLIDPSSTKLGRRYDDNSEFIQVIFPDSEIDSKCTMIVKDALNNGIDLIEFKNNEIKGITTTLSQFDKVLIGFMFTKENYTKYSSYKTFYFEPSLYPSNFEPREPEFKGSYMEIIDKTFAKVKRNDGDDSLIEFLNLKGEVVDSITIVSGSGGGGITNEKDPTVPSYVKAIKENDISNWNNKASKDFVLEQISKLINSAPEALDTLGEIAQAMKENEDVIKALNSAIGNKADKKSVPIITTTLLEDGSYSLSITTGEES